MICMHLGGGGEEVLISGGTYIRYCLAVGVDILMGMYYFRAHSILQAFTVMIRSAHRLMSTSKSDWRLYLRYPGMVSLAGEIKDFKRLELNIKS